MKISVKHNIIRSYITSKILIELYGSYKIIINKLFLSVYYRNSESFRFYKHYRCPRQFDFRLITHLNHFKNIPANYINLLDEVDYL